ncbi:Uncharacterised protein [Bacteroides xylanisolvens]|nr:Uncharacterised protein [Bacteroides xylanisolvens]
MRREAEVQLHAIRIARDRQILIHLLKAGESIRHLMIQTKTFRPLQRLFIAAKEPRQLQEHIPLDLRDRQPVSQLFERNEISLLQELPHLRQLFLREPQLFKKRIHVRHASEIDTHIMDAH